MKLSSPFKDNVLPDTYAKGASVQVRGNAVISFPFTIEDVPKGTKTFLGPLSTMILFQFVALLTFTG